MRIAPTTKTGRAGFTLIELLVVIAIIAVLASLTAGTVLRFMAKGPQVLCKNEISNLDTALASFKLTYKVDYVPSKIRLCKFLTSYGNSQLDKDSVAFLTQMWPAIQRVDAATGTVKWKTPGINWNGAGSQDVTLEGHQCLVFFLGGVAVSTTTAGVTTIGCTGFANDQRDPNNPKATRLRPFFEFDSGRLKDPGTGYPYYVDTYNLGMPYAFFSSYYNKYNTYSPYGSSDCTSLKVSPYALAVGPPVKYLKPNTWQIISAGSDGLFGPGTTSAATTWTSATAVSTPKNGKDDQSNFSGSLLGFSD